MEGVIVRVREEQAQATLATQGGFFNDSEPQGLEPLHDGVPAEDEALREREESPHMSPQPTAASRDAGAHAEGTGKKLEGDRGRAADLFVRWGKVQTK